jgi:hypothetical protein
MFASTSALAPIGSAIIASAKYPVIIAALCFHKPSSRQPIKKQRTKRAMETGASVPPEAEC